MRDTNNEVAVWTEFGELPARLQGFRDFIGDISGHVVVVGDNRGLLSSALSADGCQVTLVRHRDRLTATETAQLDNTLEMYSRGRTTRNLLIPTAPLAPGKYEYLETSLLGNDFFGLLTEETTLVANGVLFNFYEQITETDEPWLLALAATPLPRLIVRNVGQGILTTANREAKYLVKRGWAAAAEGQFVTVLRNRHLVTETSK